ncbi:hypothetical protein [Nitrincola tibetensis]|uniref:hypothetical protein n=1 Tax=Nitrincola tibetensis TaxID=2219697 RepID=UPI0012E34737|nr:hypothetical protein [Nitrincola tibetensis]
MRVHVVGDIDEKFQDITYEGAGLKKLCVVVSFRQEGDQIPDHATICYYISSKDPALLA